MLRLPHRESGADQNGVIRPLRFSCDDLRADGVGAEQTGGAMLLGGAHRMTIARERASWASISGQVDRDRIMRAI
jgi:hypothetical protein